MTNKPIVEIKQNNKKCSINPKLAGDGKKKQTQIGQMEDKQQDDSHINNFIKEKQYKPAISKLQTTGQIQPALFFLWSMSSE